VLPDESVIVAQPKTDEIIHISLKFHMKIFITFTWLFLWWVY